jgi:hypothetical protein
LKPAIDVAVPAPGRTADEASRAETALGPLQLPAAARARLQALRALWTGLLGAVAFRFACYAVMTAFALWNELRPAPSLPDTVLSALPYVGWVARMNYFAWLALYLPLACVLLWTEPARWIRYMVTGGLVCLARGVCISLTGLGPPDPAHTGVGVHGQDMLAVYLDLLSPVGVFGRGSMHAYLTKDLFFSGHTATTFLLLLYVWHRPRLRWVALFAHVLVVTTVVLGRLHYAIDIAGAYAFTFALYALREWRPRPIGAVAASD